MMNEEDFYAAVTDDAPEALFNFIEYMDAVRRNWDELTGFKQAFQDDDKAMAKAHMSDISDEDQNLLWRATTKGSVYTTAERDWYKR